MKTAGRKLRTISVYANGQPLLSVEGQDSFSRKVEGVRFPLSVEVDGQSIDWNWQQIPGKGSRATGTTKDGSRIEATLRNGDNGFSLSVRYLPAKPYHKPDKGSAEQFCKIWEPFRGKYSIRFRQQETLPGFEGYGYLTKEDRLSYSLIKAGIHGKRRVGFYNTHSTRTVGLDIDWHQGKAYKGDKPGPELAALYSEVVRRVGSYPEVVFRSDRGLHLYWFLDHRAPGKLIEANLQKKLSGIKKGGVEILPTPDHSLRIPRFSDSVDPRTFEPASFKPESIKRLSPRELFDGGLSRDDLRKESKTRASSLRIQHRLEEIEASVRPVRIGSSNEAYKTLSVAYLRIFKGDLEKAADRLESILWQDGYKGELLSRKRILEKLKSTKANLSKRGFAFEGLTGPVLEQDLFQQQFIEDLAAKWNTGDQRRRQAVRDFLQRLFGWLSYIDRVKEDHRELAAWDFFYPYFRARTKAGLYPLPAETMRKWNFRYFEVVRWLEGLGILNLKHQYSIDHGICRYYEVRQLMEVSQGDQHPLEVVEALRQEGVTQRQIAEATGVTQQAVSLWQRGKKIPKADTVETLKALLARYRC